MHLLFKVGFAAAVFAFPLGAQSEIEIDRALNTSLAPGEDVAGETTEALMKRGLRLLEQLCEVLSTVTDKSTADRAASQIYKISAEYQNWGRQVSIRPPLSEEERQAMEAAYLPAFKTANERLEAVGQQLSAARYYSSRELVQALALLVQETR